MMINLVCDCVRCKASHIMHVHDTDLDRYYNTSSLIQECFPYLSAAEREMMITGYCPACQEEIYNFDDYEDDDDDSEEAGIYELLMGDHDFGFIFGEVKNED